MALIDDLRTHRTGPGKTGKLLDAAAARIAELEALLREADNSVIWETAMPNGRDFQRRLEAALGIGVPTQPNDGELP